MAIRFNFDTSGNIEIPTMVICKRNCKRIAAIPRVNDVVFGGSMENASEFSFTVYKEQCPAWKEIFDLRNIYIPEWNTFYQIKVDLKHSTDIKKTIIATHLAEAELAEVNNYLLEINTDRDIDREDYDTPSIFYNKDNTEASILHRATKRAINYEIYHVDDTLKNINRQFSIDKKSVYDSLMEIAEEIQCYLEFDVFIDDNDKIRRTISAYDLLSVCDECGYRGEFTSKCPECGSKNFTKGYGEDTTIFVSVDNLSDEITYSTNIDQVKNCFYLEGGDEDINAAIRNCNPNGTQEIWTFSAEDQQDMSDTLYSKLYEENNGYFAVYDNYYSNVDYTASIAPEQYNNIVSKYSGAPYNCDDLEKIVLPIKGYPAIVNAYYNALDMEMFLDAVLMPSIDISYDTSAQDQESKLRQQLDKGYSGNSIGVYADSISAVNPSEANSAVLSMAEALIDSRYKVKVADYSYTKGASQGTWKFTITNYSNDEDTYTSTTNITIAITTEYEKFLRDKIEKVLQKGDNKEYGIAALMKSETFTEDLKSYGIQPLNAIKNCVDGVLSILIDQGLGGSDPSKSDVTESVYKPYLSKQTTIQKAITEREAEKSLITAMKERIEKVMSDVHSKLNIEKFLGADLWRELNIFRRESTYSNSNYIYMDSNADTFDNVRKFMEVATRELVRSATMQHTISASLKNLLVLKEFQALRDHFAIGNWIRIEVDGEVFKLRLLSYELDFSDYQNMSIEFSDVTKINDDLSDIQSVIQNAKTMGTTYSAVERQAADGAEASKVTDGWTKNGFDATQTKIINNAANITMQFDDTGMIFRRKKEYGDDFEPEQMKIINSTLAITKNGWQSISTAIGRIYYYDPADNNKLKEAYGVNAEVLIGKVILGESLGIYNSNATLKFNKDGLVVTNGTNTFCVNPNNNQKLLAISNKTQDLLWVDSTGSLHIRGDGSGLDISATDSVKNLSSSIKQNADNITAEVSRATTVEGNLSSRISVNAGNIELKVNKDGVISAINLSSEEAKIQAKKISIDGVLSVNGTFQVDTQGYMKATGGTIGGWTIGSDHIYNGIAYTGEKNTNSTGIGLYGGNWAFWAGNGRYAVTQDGHLYADNATISGSISGSTITGGSISGTSIITGDITVHDQLKMVYSGNTSDTVRTALSVYYNPLANLISELQIGAGYPMVQIPNMTDVCQFACHRPAVFNQGASFNSKDVAVEKDLYVQGHIYAYGAKNDELNSTYTINARIGDDGRIRRVASSSARYKNLISELKYSDIENLYSIPVHWFTYKDEYIDKGDSRCGTPIPGFVVEDWMDIMPIAIDLKDGIPEMWNNNIIVPLMFEMIKDMHDKNIALNKKIQELKECIEKYMN